MSRSLNTAIIFACVTIFVTIFSSIGEAKKYQSLSSSSSTAANTIKVATAQFFPTTNGATPADNTEQTAMSVTSFIFKTLAANNFALDFMVFPEFLFQAGLDYAKPGVCSGDGTNSSGQLRDYCYPVPAVNQTLLCGSNSPFAHSPANLVGCPLANSTLTLSLNVCELMANGTLFNTQVVIRNAVVVAKYRKFHPFFETCFKKPSLELVTFPVKDKTFGIFTCFDILFKDPKMDLVKMGVKYFSYSVAIPIVGLSAVELFSGMNHVNVVSANADAGQSGIVVDGKAVVRCKDSKTPCAVVYDLE